MLPSPPPDNRNADPNPVDRVVMFAVAGGMAVCGAVVLPWGWLGVGAGLLVGAVLMFAAAFARRGTGRADADGDGEF